MTLWLNRLDREKGVRADHRRGALSSERITAIEVSCVAAHRRR
jgi:hypothetical protein